MAVMMWAVCQRVPAATIYGARGTLERRLVRCHASARVRGDVDPLREHGIISMPAAAVLPHMTRP